MLTPRNKNLILNPIFLTGLLVLVVNDHWLKMQYPGVLTGKLSDLAGLLIFPLFLAYIFPWRATGLRQHLVMPLLTGLWFIFWKSPESTSLIDWYNTWTPIGITRVVDYTDLVALVMLLPAGYIIHRAGKEVRWVGEKGLWGEDGRVATLLLIPCALAFMATSPPKRYLHNNHVDGDIDINTSFTIKMTPEQVLQAMEKEGFHPVPDTSAGYSRYPHSHYIMTDLAFPSSGDTLHFVRFSLYDKGKDKTDFYLRTINKKGDIKLADWRTLKMYAKYYRYIIKTNVIHGLR